MKIPNMNIEIIEKIFATKAKMPSSVQSNPSKLKTNVQQLSIVNAKHIIAVKSEIRLGTLSIIVFLTLIALISNDMRNKIHSAPIIAAGTLPDKRETHAAAIVRTTVTITMEIPAVVIFPPLFLEETTVIRIPTKPSMLITITETIPSAIAKVHFSISP